MTDNVDKVKAWDAIVEKNAEIARLRRGIGEAMGCLDAASPYQDERLAWWRLHDVMQGREPRQHL